MEKQKFKGGGCYITEEESNALSKNKCIGCFGTGVCRVLTVFKDDICPMCEGNGKAFTDDKWEKLHPKQSPPILGDKENE